MGDDKDKDRKRPYSKATVMKLQAHLMRVRKQNGGMLTPAMIVKDAAKDDSPLHEHFTWDDTEASNLWRLHQARQLVCKLKINIGTEEAPRMVRTMFSMPDEDGDESYIPMAEIKASPRMSAAVLERAKADVQAWIERYAVYAEMMETRKAAAKVLAELAKIRIP